MMKRLLLPTILIVVLLACGSGLLIAQEKTTPPSQSASQQNAAAEQQAPASGKTTNNEGHQKKAPQPGIGAELAEASNEAAGEPEENAEFKESSSVRFIASITHLSLRSAYWLSIFLNFAILAVLVVLISKSKLPAMFRTRTGEIQRGIAEARKASDDANRRLANIETRLARLDADVAGMRAIAETEAAAEEQRLKQAAEEDKRKIVDAANSEIAAAAKLARRELKAYTADLAIALAGKRINIDAETDRALVSNFVDQLNAPESTGKDGE